MFTVMSVCQLFCLFSGGDGSHVTTAQMPLVSYRSHAMRTPYSLPHGHFHTISLGTQLPIPTTCPYHIGTPSLYIHM